MKAKARTEKQSRGLLCRYAPNNIVSRSRVKFCLNDTKVWVQFAIEEPSRTSRTMVDQNVQQCVPVVPGVLSQHGYHAEAAG